MTSNTARRRAAAARSGGPTDEPPAAPADMWKLRGPDGAIAPGWYLLPLRLFLGVTFLFAGLQKLADPNFLRASAPGSIHAQLVGASHTSPIGTLLGHLVGASSTLGVLIALGEIAVGVGALLGLLTRVAAVGGVLLAFSLFLSVSYRTSPYYTGADIVFLFAWTPFVLGGALGAPALDTWLATRPPSRASTDDGSRGATMSRGAVIGLVAGGTAVLTAAVTGIGRALAPSGSSSTPSTLPKTTTTTTAPTSTTGGAGATTTTTAPVPKGTAIGPASSVPVGGSAAFTDPTTGDPSLVIQHTANTFVAFDAICPHAGCTVAYQPGANIIACPCHGSEFNPRTGAVVVGPATSGLTPIKVIKGANGDLYVV
jgi:thiosulfate dehydrogenase (quinone) large subunit